MFNNLLPYNELPLLPPAVEIETKSVLKKSISASRALAVLNGALAGLPNPTLFLDTIHLQEAKASSEVEHIITTNDELYTSFIAEKQLTNPATKEVLRYKDALWLGLNELHEKPFMTTNLCIKIVQCITRHDASIRVTPGTTLKNSHGEIIYTPPTGELVLREKLQNWEAFVNKEDDLDPLVKMAVLHYQFEAIHPFIDGNGRTGRILLLLYLKLSGLLEIPALYVSEYIIAHKQRYYESLRGVTEHGEWEAFILYMLDMIEVSAQKGLKRLHRIALAMEQMTNDIKERVPKLYSKELIELLFRLPYTKRQHLVRENMGNEKTVGKLLMSLEQAQILRSVRVGKEKLYVNPYLMRELEGH